MRRLYGRWAKNNSANILAWGLALGLCLLFVTGGAVIFLFVSPPIHVLGLEDDCGRISTVQEERSLCVGTEEVAAGEAIRFTDQVVDPPSVEFTFTEDNKVNVIYHNCTPTEGVELLVNHLKNAWWSQVALLEIDGFRKFNSGDIAWVVTKEENNMYRFIYMGERWQLFPFTLEEERWSTLKR